MMKRYKDKIQFPLPTLCYSCWLIKKNRRPVIWLADRVWTSLLQATAERNLTKLDKKKYSNVLCQVCSSYSGRWRPLIGWSIFDFFSATPERNFTKLGWKQLRLASIVWEFFSGRYFNKWANGTHARARCKTFWASCLQ